MTKFYKNTRANVVKIFKVLDGEEGPITIGEISRRSGLHKWTVSRTLDVWMGGFVDIAVVEELRAVGIPMKLVSLRNGCTEQQVLRGLEVREGLK